MNHNGFTRSVSTTTTTVTVTTTTIPSDTVNEYIHAKICTSDNIWHKYWQLLFPVQLLCHRKIVLKRQSFVMDM